ncbi:MAG: TMEM175 family protein [Bacteroidota bacterium]|nr:TMEM175 family protein [Bacteroidota bacterium]
MPVNYQFDKKRFEAFIDAIIAILLTILVLEIKIPENKIESASTYEQVKSLTPYIVSYLASFMLIVGFWIDYHLLFVNITNITKRFIILNMLFILSISFAPFVTAFAGKHYHDAFAVALLSTTYCIMNLFFILIFLYAKSKKLTDPDFFKNKGTDIYSVISFIAIFAAIPLAYVNTYISFTIFLIIFGWHLIKRKWQ